MWCDDTDMTRTRRARLALAIGGFVALTIFLPSTVRDSLPRQSSSDGAERADLGAALRVAMRSEVAAIASAPFERVWSKASTRGRFSLAASDLARTALTCAAFAVALVLTAFASTRATRLAASTSGPRAPPLLFQRQ
jgi:hypothetical protein